MIYSVFNNNGRIGNMLFIIAATATHARRLGTDFRCVVNSWRDGYTEQFFDNIFRKVKFVYEIPKGVEILVIPSFSYSPIPERDNICYEGFFQSERFMDRGIALDLFRVPDEFKESLLARYPVLSEGGVVSVNVRRGDFLRLAATFPVCNRGYYMEAIEKMGSDKKFVFTSDDIQWCRREFIGDNFYFVDGTDILTDLYVPSLCKHNIISNSSFSWWGAWLNENPDKRVIAPLKWFGVALHSKIDTTDLFPEGWERVNNPLSINQKIFVCRFYLKQCYIFVLRLFGSKRPYLA